MKSIALILGVSFALFACTAEVGTTASAGAAAIDKKDVVGDYRAEKDADLAAHDIYELSIDKHLDCKATVIDPIWFAHPESGAKKTISGKEVRDLSKKDKEVALNDDSGCKVDLDEETITVFVNDDPTGEDDAVKVVFDFKVTDKGNLKVKADGSDWVKLESR
jgi:hypothetical protein